MSDEATIPVMNPIARKMTKVLQLNNARFKISEIQLGERSQFTIYLGEYNDELVRNIKQQFLIDEDLRTHTVLFRAGLKGVPGPKKSTYRLTKADALGVSIEHA